MAVGRMIRLMWAMLAVTLLAGCATMTGCDEPAPAGFESVTISGHTFMLELAADNSTRMLGLGGRESIAEDGGMLFAFKKSSLRQFVMRDCLVDIDIIYLDAAGNITAMHQMTAEAPKADDETVAAYNDRLKRYSSRYDAQFAVELQGGMLDRLGLERGGHIDIDPERLGKLAK